MASEVRVSCNGFGPAEVLAGEAAIVIVLRRQGDEMVATTAFHCSPLRGPSLVEALQEAEAQVQAHAAAVGRLVRWQRRHEHE